MKSFNSPSYYFFTLPLAFLFDNLIDKRPSIFLCLHIIYNTFVYNECTQCL